MTDLEIIEKRMGSGEPFTYGELLKIPEIADKAAASRLADKTIQRWRRKGWIKFTRQGRDCVWHLTEKGQSEALK